jgi:hypothetical protein
MAFSSDDPRSTAAKTAPAQCPEIYRNFTGNNGNFVYNSIY